VNCSGSKVQDLTRAQRRPKAPLPAGLHSSPRDRQPAALHSPGSAPRLGQLRQPNASLRSRSKGAAARPRRQAALRIAQVRVQLCDTLPC